MSGCSFIIAARHLSQSGSTLASIGAVIGTILRSSAGGRPRMLRSCRSVVTRSDVAVTSASRHRSRLCRASATLAVSLCPRSARSLATTSSQSLTAMSRAQTWTSCCTRAQYCCSIERTWAMSADASCGPSGSPGFGTTLIVPRSSTTRMTSPFFTPMRIASGSVSRQTSPDGDDGTGSIAVRATATIHIMFIASILLRERRSPDLASAHHGTGQDAHSPSRWVENARDAATRRGPFIAAPLPLPHVPRRRPGDRAPRGCRGQ